MSRKWQTKKEMLQFSSKSFQSLAFHHFTRQGVPQPRADRTEWPVADRHETRPWNDQLMRWRWSQTSPAGYVGDASQVIREVARCQAAQRSERQSRMIDYPSEAESSTSWLSSYSSRCWAKPHRTWMTRPENVSLLPSTLSTVIVVLLTPTSASSTRFIECFRVWYYTNCVSLN